MFSTAKHHFFLLALLNLLLCGGIVAHHVADALCVVQGIGCISADSSSPESVELDSSLHSGFALPTVSAISLSIVLIVAARSPYFNLRDYVRPPRLRPPLCLA